MGYAALTHPTKSRSVYRSGGLWHRAGMKPDDVMRRVAVVAALLLPFFLFYGRAVADALIVTVDVLFLARCMMRSQWDWARQVWVWLAGALWLWQLAASIVTGPEHSALEALVMLRLPLLVAALQDWVLAGPRARKAMWWVVLGLAVWTASQCWEQILTARNLMGFPRWGDGALTGPFYKPRAGEIFLYVALPGLMPVVLRLISAGRRLRAWGLGLAVLLGTETTMVLIGQRMPNLLFLLGLCITGLLVRRFRAPLLIAAVVAVAAVAALPVISPPTFGKLVMETARQVPHFIASPYGQLYTRASVMIAAHPWMGFGFEGFKDFCGQSRYLHGWPGLGIPDAVNVAWGCNLHPHNYYLQIGTMAGLPGLALFVALVVLWLRRMGRALRPQADAVQAMVFVTVCVIYWPLASTSGLFTLDTAGWVFLMTGWGLAASG